MSISAEFMWLIGGLLSLITGLFVLIRSDIAEIKNEIKDLAIAQTRNAVKVEAVEEHIRVRCVNCMGAKL